MQQPRRSPFSILLAGLLVGAGLGIYVILPRFRGLSLMIAVGVLLVLCGYMGYRASASTGKVGSGGLVGFQIGLISSVVFIVVGVIDFLANSDRILVPTDIPFANAFLTVFLFVALVFWAGMLCLVGWYGGTLGGTIGKSRSLDPAFSPQYQGAMPMSLPPYPPQGFAPPPQNTLQGTIPPPYPPGTSASISSQRTAPLPLPPPSPPKRLKRWYSPDLIVLWIPLILMLLGGGSVGVYQTASGRWPWTAGPSPDAIAWSGSQFVAVGSRGILTSPDGRTWTVQPSNVDAHLLGIAWSGSQFVAVGYTGTILTSPDGSSWTSQPSGSLEDLYGVAWSGSQFVAVGLVRTILTSPDGRSWTSQSSIDATQSLSSVVWSGSQFVAVGDNGTILTSPDGSSWTTAQNPGSSQPLNSVVWSGTQLVAVGQFGAILTSPDGRTWTSQSSIDISQNLTAIAWSGSQFVAVGYGSGYSIGNVILTSPDGRTWTAQHAGTSQGLYGVAWSGSQFVAVGSGTILTSPDGRTWTATAQLSDASQEVSAVA